MNLIVSPVCGGSSIKLSHLNLADLTICLKALHLLSALAATKWEHHNTEQDSAEDPPLI